MMRRRRRILVRTQQKKRKIWNWGVSGKTGWDWLQLLIVPLVLATLGFWFTAQQNRTNNQIALDQQQEATLNAYLDHMSTLLLDNNLRESKQGDEVRNVARIDTLTALRRLDPVRKGVLLQFLYDSGLIVLQSDYLNSVIIDLSGADLSGVIMPSEVTANRSIIIANHLDNANLSMTDMSNANLSYISFEGTIFIATDLHNADLYSASLQNANFDNASLKDADLKYGFLEGASLLVTKLEGANLTYANLNHADLSYADLSNADLSYANLNGAKVTYQQLDQAKSLQGTTMPDGSKHP